MKLDRIKICKNPNFNNFHISETLQEEKNFEF